MILLCCTVDADISTDNGQQRRVERVSQVRANVPGEVLAFDRRRLWPSGSSLLSVDGSACTGRQLATTSIMQRADLRHVKVRYVAPLLQGRF